MDAAAIVNSNMSVADKIRGLDKLGYPRAEIARLLGKRYQHVRNVLEADSLAGRPSPTQSGLAESGKRFEPGPAAVAKAPEEGQRYRLDITSDGAVTLPPEVMAQLGLRPRGFAMAEWRDGVLRLISVEQWLRELQAWGASQPFSPESAVDALLEERRREVEKEEAEFQAHMSRPAK